MLITESLVASGADIFVGYPITPSNRFYTYGQRRFPLFLPAPDEISVLQWMAGASMAGKIPVTATAFPGLALMVESINMAHTMELPMVIVVTQRLGPSTGSATIGAQGDLSLISGIVPGYPIPTFCPANFNDCWSLANKAVETAIDLRTPVFLLTSKEMVMTSRSFDLSSLDEIVKLKRTEHGHDDFRPYDITDTGIAPLPSLKSNFNQVRINSSMHNKAGRIVKNEESLNVTRSLRKKILAKEKYLSDFEYLINDKSELLIVSYGISALAARDAYNELLEKGKSVSLLIIKTLIPVSDEIIKIIDEYNDVLIVEENINGQLKELLYGYVGKNGIRSVNKLGSMITPSEITQKVL